MPSRDVLFAELEADPRPVVEIAIRRLTEIHGRPKVTASEVRFCRKGSFSIKPEDGRWYYHEDKIGGGSWQLAQYVGLSEQEIAGLYGLEEGARLDEGRLQRLREQGRRRRQARERELQEKKRHGRAEAKRLLKEASPLAPGDPASSYLHGRDIDGVTAAFFHAGPRIIDREGKPLGLSPSVLFPVTDRSGEICAAHCVQLNLRTGGRQRHPAAKLTVGSLSDGYVRFGKPGSTICLGEGAETVASVHVTVPAWRCLASCSAIRLVELDHDLAGAEQIVLLAERGAEKNTEMLGQETAARFEKATVYIVYVPDVVAGEKADMNDALQADPALVRHALSKNQLKKVEPPVG